ncbi:hypothetical protein N0V90_009795 [Kalmusia sp. IMI 367209]|nr:hypothetical protein N0V90_009795 [Kalmusia sp. IMI 367209]
MPPGGLQAFATRSGRPASPSRPQSASSKRAAAAANAKVQVAKTSLHLEPAQQHLGVRRQPDSNVNHLAAQPNNGQRRDSGESVNGRHDRYETDAESLDTTVNGRSIILAQKSQRPGEQQSAHDDSHGGNSEYSEEDQSGDEDRDDEDDTDDYGYEEDSHEKLQFFNEAERLMEGNIFGEGNSYPSTTSGPPDDLFDVGATGQQLPVDDAQGNGPKVPAPQNIVQGQATRQVQPVLRRQDHPPIAPQTLSTQPTIYQRGAAVRADQRANTNLTVRGGSGYQANTTPGLSSQAPSYSQIVPEGYRSANVTSHHRPTVASGQLPQRGTRTSTDPSRATALRQVAPTGPGVHLAQPQLKEESTNHYQSIEADPVRDIELPIEDYDKPDLFKLTYDQLKEESFDDMPRGKNEVLSKDMQHMPLAERLGHVQKNLNAGDQDKFFRALPTRDWEDAGDWFLDQFNNIITRAKEARQKKRKLARDFEDEIEKRHRHVAKRQQNVEGALNQMKTHGQGLIPKSPKQAKSVQPRKR